MKLIGVTGLMGSGKTTLCKKIIKKFPQIKYINVDDVRNELIENEYFLREMSDILGKNIKNRQQLNELIYNNPMSMALYKTILYQKLFQTIKTFDDTDVILVEWALIIQDNLLCNFDKLIIINKDINDILNNVSFPDLPKEEVTKRLNLQKSQFEDFNNIGIDYKIYKDFEDTINFIGEI